MQTVYKYYLPDTGCQPVSMPAGSRILSVAYQGNRLVLHAQVDTEIPTVTREFKMLCTGEAYDFAARKHVGTAHEGGHVVHVYEVLG